LTSSSRRRAGATTLAAHGQPQRPFSAFRPGERAPGEAIPPEYRDPQFDLAAFDPISALRAIQPILDDPAAGRRIEIRDKRLCLWAKSAHTGAGDRARRGRKSAATRRVPRPIAEARAAAYYGTVARIHRLDPGYATLTSPDFRSTEASLEGARGDLAKAQANVARRGFPKDWYINWVSEWDIDSRSVCCVESFEEVVARSSKAG
jgi:hypothetical protein